MISSAVGWLTEHEKSLKRAGLLFALLLFFGGLYLALSAVPDLRQRVNIAPLAILFLIGPPVVIAHATTEFWLLARAAGSPVRWRAALEVTIFASAANLLSQAGGIATKLAALRIYGTGFVRSTLSMLMFAFIWGGLAFCYSALALYLQGSVHLAVPFGLAGMCMLIGSVAGFTHLRVPYGLPCLSALMRLASLPLEGLRLMLAAWGVGAAIGFDQASVLVVASFLGAVVSFVPSGLGVREAIIAALSPAIGLSPALGFLTGVASRLIYMSGQAIAAALVLWMQRQPRHST